jgi:cellulose synthase/poly-beta-1,6-N-acetylglucosamine synthase-like glycosyltransferase
MSIRRRRAEDPPAAADEHARPTGAGPEAAPADGEAEAPAAGSADEAASGAVGTEIPPGDGEAEAPASDGTAGVPVADGAATVAAADGAAGIPAAGGAAASSGADGKAEARSAGSEAKVPSANGKAKVPSTDGEVRVPPVDGKAEVLPANGEADFPPAGEYASWPADDEAALELNGDTLVLPVLGDIDDVTAPPSAEQQHPASAPSRPHIAVGGTVALLDDQIAASGIDYKAYSALAGPLARPRWDEPYRVQYRKIHRNRREWLATRLIAFVLVILDLRFLYWLIFQSKYPHLNGWQWHTSAHAAITDAYLLLLAAMAIGSIVMQIFLLVNVLTVSRACLAARDPIPVEPDTRLRVAFLTTLVPDKEPLEMAERTLRAAKTIVYGGQFDLWLLDEGNSDAVKAMCRRLGVRHFSRKNRGHLELDHGTFADKTKHGNHNRWLWEHAGDYDVVMFVDPDHVPLPTMAERLLGYFRDPEVAFVVSPQFYGNQENRITRWAESAQYLFHGVIQRAGNRRQCAMLVGTNVAVRTSAIKGGYVASITEDMATSFKIHATKSPTGRAWRSVYTPDLVAVGEGPSSWTDFFSQQTRWSAGTYDFLMRRAWREAFKLRPGAMLHYGLMLTYYPSVAIGWIMGITISACYLGFGVASLRTDAGWWLTYYVDVAAMQFVLYWFMRRHNVSPHEPAGSSGLSGMVLSAITAPIYARSLIKVVFRRKLRFDVTAKGSSSSPDRLWTFRYSLAWAVVPIIILVVAVTHHRPYPMMIAWTVVILTVCLLPVGIWLFDRARSGRGTGTPPSSAEENRASEPSEPQLTLAAK